MPLHDLDFLLSWVQVERLALLYAVSLHPLHYVSGVFVTLTLVIMIVVTLSLLHRHLARCDETISAYTKTE